MKLVPYDMKKLNYKPTKNSELFAEFMNSDVECAQLVEHGHKDAKCAQSCLRNSALRFGYGNSIAIVIRKERYFWSKSIDRVWTFEDWVSGNRASFLFTSHKIHLILRKEAKAMNNKIDIVRIIGVAGMILGGAASLLSGWANEKKMEQAVDKKVQAALAEKSKKMEES